ncbi:MAG: hypothetical protein JHD15_17745 [Phenylobacterium sp.]|jgi:uncharacterized membrane protein YedE/YeeE|uniref:hypothetical protein n=1 Tax=unclassified Phenylobacterium TaxID=2640670 RepID=UPI0008CAEFFF|nr:MULTISPECIES: hypothetical protein [unclassified Phenylobacterium]MBJ7412189.1 hypothetical protein [Phenylobacterium sp.]OHB28539.1 MAG: hypothetical protein A2790_16155 [Phenylobacterium sp. RIFCSPHIGHO2_01_FULL_69_31]
MDLRLLVALGLGLAALSAFAGWRGARPPNPMKGPRLIPWRAIMVFAAAGAVIVLVQIEQAVGFAPR